ncbi:hypothetical protein ACIGO9_24865 [Nocardia asteroides]|uniref:hypothetical protein n=1 Tax=Nocardia asteroides TaxID=1824 RepID=UPI0037CB8B0E
MTKSVDTILDEGAIALNYFWHLTPLYVRVAGTDDGWPRERISEIYNYEQGMNTEKLAETWGATAGLLAEARAQRDVQRQANTTLTANWKGEAGTQGSALVTSMIQVANGDIENFAKFSDAIFAASTGLLQIVQTKVAIIRLFMPLSGLVEVGTLSASEIEAVINARDTGVLSETIWTKLLQSPVAAGKTVEKDLETTKDLARQWVDTVFRPDFVAKRDAFVKVCEDYKIKVQEAYRPVIEAAALMLEDPKYPMATAMAPVEPQQPKPVENQPKTTEQPKTTNDQTTAAGTQTTTDGGQNTSTGGQAAQTTASGTTTDSSTSTGSTTKTTSGTQDSTATDDSDDSTTDESDISSALSTLSSTISELGSTLSNALSGELGDALTSAVETAGTSIGDGIEQLTEQASTLLSGDQEMSFQLGETKVSVGSGEDGLSLTTTGADGTTNQYRLTLDENGIPVLTQDSGSGADASSANSGDEPAGQLGSGTPQSGTGQGEAGLDGSEGKVVGPDETTPETPDLTNAPVTSEIGSGEASSGSVAGGVPVGPRSARQETDGEHVPTVGDHSVSSPGESGAVLAEAGPL